MLEAPRTCRLSAHSAPRQLALGVDATGAAGITIVNQPWLPITGGDALVPALDCGPEHGALDRVAVPATGSSTHRQARTVWSRACGTGRWADD